MNLDAIRDFLRRESAGGIVLMVAAAAALVAANSAAAPLYAAFLDIHVAFRIGSYELAKPVLIWINDLLMAIFFLLVGLEIKREFADGELSSIRQAALPGIAAAAGMAVPAAIYLALTLDDPAAARGWAIPSATDIAFALGVMSFAAARVPISLKILLTAIAILDDLSAIVIIAAFYTDNLSWQAMTFAGVAIAGLTALNLAGVTKTAPYILIGAALWLAVLKSGVHATLAGVVLALFIPLQDKKSDRSPLREMEHALLPWVAFCIVPLFGFANAGVSFAGVTLASLLEPIPLGIAAGLFLGKQIGIFGALRLACALGLAERPAGATWLQIYGLAVLCGIGFTMSLFIGTLAFEGPEQAAPLRLGVLAGSILATLVGLCVLRFAPRARFTLRVEATRGDRA